MHLFISLLSGACLYLYIHIHIYGSSLSVCMALKSSVVENRYHAVQPSNDGRRRRALIKRFRPLCCCSSPRSCFPPRLFVARVSVSCLLFLSLSQLSSHRALPASRCSPSVSLLLSLSLSGASRNAMAVTSLAFGSRRSDWCRPAGFNTYLGYLYRFGAAGCAVSFCLLGPLIHSLRSGALAFMGRVIWHLNVPHDTALGYEL